MGTGWVIHVDAERCDGTGLCVGTAPEHFELDDTGHSRPKVSPVAPDEAITAAVECCPMEAISVTDASDAPADARSHN